MRIKVRHGKRLYKQMAMEVAVRNPERYPAILSVFAKYEGKVLDDKCILEIYKDLFVYRAIESDYLDIDNSTEDDIRQFVKVYLKHNNIVKQKLPQLQFRYSIMLLQLLKCR